MKIFISSDHAGFSLKDQIYNKLKNGNYRITNLGPFNDKSVDYPIYAKRLANTVSRNKSSFGILVCGSGTGMAMAANKVKNIRAAVCYNVKNTKLSRLHNNANIITVGSRLISKNLAFKLVNIFLKTKFEGGRHLRRIKKI
ncbi:ribose 5-phosphate isomerase B [Candidatus Pelagibacter sp.]|nr:ribose 5-phosphate isomerase B [Candidatus Pelagibacter sp.]